MVVDMCYPMGFQHVGILHPQEPGIANLHGITEVVLELAEEAIDT